MDLTALLQFGSSEVPWSEIVVEQGHTPMQS
jgi:hypothetical protein